MLHPLKILGRVQCHPLGRNPHESHPFGSCQGRQALQQRAGISTIWGQFSDELRTVPERQETGLMQGLEAEAMAQRDSLHFQANGGPAFRANVHRQR